MKKLSLLFLTALTFILSSCSEEKQPEVIGSLPFFSFEIKASSFGKAKLKNDTVNVLFLETTLHNNTNDTLRYGTMSCSWNDIYEISNSELSLDAPVCTKNTPAIIKVDPNSNAKTFFNVLIGKLEKGCKEKLKLGLKLIEIKSDKEIDGVPEKIKSFPAKDIMWSNEIEL